MMVVDAGAGTAILAQIPVLRSEFWTHCRSPIPADFLAIVGASLLMIPQFQLAFEICLMVMRSKAPLVIGVLVRLTLTGLVIASLLINQGRTPTVDFEYNNVTVPCLRLPESEGESELWGKWLQDMFSGDPLVQEDVDGAVKRRTSTIVLGVALTYALRFIPEAMFYYVITRYYVCDDEGLVPVDGEERGLRQPAP
jgi:hypothetical protein